MRQSLVSRRCEASSLEAFELILCTVTASVFTRDVRRSSERLPEKKRREVHAALELQGQQRRLGGLGFSLLASGAPGRWNGW